MVTALAIHFSSIFGSFVCDDIPLIAEHSGISSSGSLLKAWSRDYGQEFAGESRGFYRPLFVTGVFLVHAVAGPSPIAFHIVSLAILCAATFLVTRIVSTGLQALAGLAIIAGMFYAVHPARVETVSLIMSLPDLMVEVFAMGAVLFLLRSPAISTWRASTFCFWLALLAALTKESAYLVFPALAVTAAACPVSDGASRRAPALLPALAIGLALGLGFLCRHLAGVRSPVPMAETLACLVGRGAMPALQTIGLAAKNVLLPGPVVFWWQPAGQESFVALAAIAIILFSMGCMWLLFLRRHKLLYAMLIAWVAVNIVNLMLLTVGGYPYSQRYLALAPAVVLLFAGCWRLVQPLAVRTTGKPVQRLAWLCIAVYLACHGAFAVTGTFTCRNQLGFFLAMHKANPRDVVPLGAVAQTLNKNGAPAAEVEALVRKATSLDSTHPQIPLLHNMVLKRHMDERLFQEALQFADWSLSLLPADADKTAFKAVALASLDRYPEALVSIDLAISAHPDNKVYRQLRTQIADNMAAAQAQSLRNGTQSQ